MKRRHAIFVAILMLALPLFALAQAQDQEGRVWGEYTVHQSIELGGHIAEAEGNQQTYSTFVNLGTGPRVLSQELSMQSRTHEGLLFDNLYLSSFGFGGDPENMARLRIQKSKFYNFVGLYRRDKNFFDYDLFVNPLNLNPGITTCGVGCTNAFTPSALLWFGNSPHMQATTRNMGDFLLTLLPESKISFRLGYARNATYGLVHSTLEDPRQTILTEDSQWRSDRYQFGVDLKLFPRTTLSGDVFFEHDKNDIGFVDNTLLFTLGNTGGPPIDIGFPLPPLAGTIAGSATDCSNGSRVSVNSSGSFVINPNCKNGVLVNSGLGGAYFRRGNVRTDIPTGQLSLQSNYFRNLDITASGTYSSATSDFLNFNEFAHGARTGPNPFLVVGTPSSERVSANADLGVTYHLSKSWSVSDKFRWLNWREPGALAQAQFNCFLNGANLATGPGGSIGFPTGTLTLTPLFNPCFPAIAGPIPGLTLTGLTTSGSATSSNYQTLSAFNTIFGERSYFNTFKVNWQPSRRFGGYVGYRYARRSFQDGNADITGILANVTANFVNNGTGTPPTTPTCTVASNPNCDPTTGIITNIGSVDSEEINQHTALLGVVVRPVDAWRINGDVEWLYADNTFVLIAPRHQQRVRVYSTYKVKPWLSINGGLHFVETRNDFAAGEPIDTDVSGNTCNPVTNPQCLLFPAAFIPTAYGHKDHWRYYTLGTTLTPKDSKFTFDLGWTLQDQNINSATCMPISAGPVFGGTVTAPTACNSNTTARALLLDYQETTNSGYTNIAYHPVKRVTLNFGYEITEDNGHTNWLRLDNGSGLQVVGDIFGNSPALTGNALSPCAFGSAGAGIGCIYPGPFPDQPLGPQAVNWHKASAGIGYEVAKGVEFKGMWSYYDYNSKDHPESLILLRALTPRDFHANVGTVSLRYSF